MLPQGFRNDSGANDFSHDEACLFVHFLPEFKQHTTCPELEELITRFRRGFLNRELRAKCMEADPQLTVSDFAFISSVSTAAQSANQSRLRSALALSEEAEVTLACSMMTMDLEYFKLYTLEQKRFNASTRREEYEANANKESLISEAVAGVLDTSYPCGIVRSDAVGAWVADATMNWSAELGLAKENVMQVLLVALDKLGLHWFKNWNSISKSLSANIAADPANACCLITSPLVGKPGWYIHIYKC